MRESILKTFNDVKLATPDISRLIFNLTNHRIRLESQLYSYMRNKECLADFLSRLPKDTPLCEEIIEARDSLERFNAILSQYAWYCPYC